MDGLASRCKECMREDSKQFREQNPEYGKQWRERNHEYLKEYRDEHREQLREYRLGKSHTEEYRANRRQYKRRWYAKNKERMRQYYQENRDKLLEYQHRYWKENPEQLRVISARRRERAIENGGTHTAADIKRQYKAQRGRCYYCGIKVGKVYHVDHVIPLARGGSNGPENLVIACPACNLSKSAKLPHEWAGTDKLL